MKLYQYNDTLTLKSTGCIEKYMYDKNNDRN